MIIIQPKGIKREAFVVVMRYPIWDILHNTIPKKWFYGGLFFDKFGDFEIVESGDVVIKEPDGSFLLCKGKDFDNMYEVVEN